jgi:hypothetical protein
MAYLGVFRDTYYSPANVLPPGAYSAITLTSGVIPAADLVGGVTTYLTTSDAAALTTDTAANICEALTSLGVPPTNGPVYTGTTWLLKIKNLYSGTLTLTAGSGVSFTSSGTNTIATDSVRTYIASVTASSLTQSLIALQATDEVTVTA